MSKLEALGVAKRYRSREVVKDLSLSIERGQVVGLLRPNTEHAAHQRLVPS